MAVKDIDLSILDIVFQKRSKTVDQEKPTIKFLSINSKIDSLNIKILPGAEQEKKKFAQVVFNHWNLGDDKKLNCICLEKTFPNSGKKCPVCEKIRELTARGLLTDELRQQLDSTPSTKVRCVVLKQNGEKVPTDHITVLTQNSLTFYRWLVEKAKDPESPDYVSYTEPYVVSIKRAESGKGFERSILTWEQAPGQSLYRPTDEEREFHKTTNERVTWDKLIKTFPPEEIAEKIKKWLTTFDGQSTI